MTIQKFAKNIIALLKVENTSISYFEKRHGVSAGYLSRKANKGGAFDLSIALSMANELHVAIDDLFTQDFVKSCEKQIIENQIKELQGKLEKLNEVE